MIDILTSQQAYVPEVIGVPTSTPMLIVGGMGGSALPALMLRYLGISPYIVIHRGYDIPEPLPAGASCVAISYSGTTEETLSFARAALDRGLPLSVISSGGELATLAKEHGLPYVEVPPGMQPRDAILMTSKALLALAAERPLLDGVAFAREDAEREGSRLADELKGSTPVFYTTTRNEALGYLGKILLNETAKTPAFSNVFPELNHNEMQGFGENPANLGTPFVAVFVRDASDDVRVIHRMELTERLLREQGVKTALLDLPQGSRAESLLFGWWTMRTLACTLADAYGVAPDDVPLIETFKKAL